MPPTNATRVLRTALLVLALGSGSPAGARENLRVLTWPGYADSDLVSLFEKQFGVTVQVTYVSSDDVLWEKMNAHGGADFDVFAIKSRVHFRRGFDDSGFARAILLVEPAQPFLGTTRLEGLAYENVDLARYYPYGNPPTPATPGEERET